MITDKKYNIPFDFILDYLYPKEVVIKPMFGCFSLYMNNRIYFFLRNRDDKEELNGVWVAVATPNDYESLAKELHSINQDRELVEDNKSDNKWLLLSAFDDQFESLVNQACDLILNNDKRIGKITKGSLFPK
ncbi:MAG: hypothetical protein IIA45_14900 [Bacteroidetes bacterium]|nr:hypothetical protein [Bacteroidota bacterium]